MTTARLAVATLALVVVAGCALSPGAAADASSASRLFAPEATWFDAGIRPTDASPPGFVVALRADMPTPGFTFAIDGVDVDRQARRIVARVTERAPTGMVSQVIAPATLEIDVPPLERGTWVLEVRTRRGPDGVHVPRHATVLQAN